MNPLHQRTAGVLVPLFSIRSDQGWGIGELPDIGTIAPWAHRAGFSVLSLLPLLEIALGQDSPYSALSAFALDPIYLALDGLEDFAEIGGVAAMPADERATLDRLRASGRVDYGAVRALKGPSLRRAFERFQSSVARTGSARAHAFERFREEQRDWLPDYSLFRALKNANPYSWWQAWPRELKERHPQALERARAQHAADCTFYEWLQWLANGQLKAARAAAREHGVLLAGDLPFMVAEDSADAWTRQRELRLDATVGTPPDDFSTEGQDWGLPAYRWQTIAENGYEWLRQRGRRTAEGFDIVRVDHVVGFYRTYTRPKDKTKPDFSPSREPEQIRQGEAVLAALGEAGTALIAEDLGTVPPFVRRSLTKLGVPGFRVLRWEKDDAVFRDPADWPRMSVGTTGTHDTDTIAVWWESLDTKERTALRKLPAFARLRDSEALHFGEAAHEAILDAVYSSGSNLALLPVPDVFGLRERINLPGTLGAGNWTWRMPWTNAELLTDAEARRHTERAARLARASERQATL
ncbi:MAG: 4-alpha-glucanotransferase [Myxococcales bacterium]